MTKSLSMPSFSVLQSNPCNNDVRDNSLLCILSLIMFILLQVMDEDVCKFQPQEQFGVVCNNGDYVVFQCRLLKPDTNVSYQYYQVLKGICVSLGHRH